VITTIALGLFSFGNPLLFYWVVFVLALQRGPILPCQQELAPPSDERSKQIATWLLALPLLVLPPFPVDLVIAIQNLQNPVPY
jgi:hypothetical protein